MNLNITIPRHLIYVELCSMMGPLALFSRNLHLWKLPCATPQHALPLFSRSKCQILSQFQHNNFFRTIKAFNVQEQRRHSRTMMNLAVDSRIMTNLRGLVSHKWRSRLSFSPILLVSDSFLPFFFQPWRSCIWSREMAQPKYLSGDGAAIKEFIDKFDVRYFDLSQWLVANSN